MTGIVRAIGPLTYPGRVEYVDPHPSSLGRPEQFVGVPVRRNHGAHGGHTIGRVISARRAEAGIEATMRIDDEDALEEIRTDEATQFSCGYDCTTDENGTQRLQRVTEVALVERGRCGSTCSITRADAEDEPELGAAEVARARMIERLNVRT